MINKGDLKPIKDGETWEDVSKNQKANFDKLADEVNKKVEKSGSKVLSDKNFTAEMEQKLNGIAENANNYVHPNNAGNKHIPSGGSAGQVLTWMANGEAQWSTPAAGASTFKAVSAPAYATGVNISQAEFDGLINKLKLAGVFK